MRYKGKDYAFPLCLLFCWENTGLHVHHLKVSLGSVDKSFNAIDFLAIRDISWINIPEPFYPLIDPLQRQPLLPRRLELCSIHQSGYQSPWLISSESLDHKIYMDWEAVVVDNGSGRIKAGFSGNNMPSVVFPSVVGYPKRTQAIVGSLDGLEVGFDALAKRGVLKLSHPIEHGIVTDWDEMESLWEHLFSNELRISPSEHPIFLTEAAMNPKWNRERMLELVFERFDAPATYIAIQAIMALYASGRTTGVVLDSGDGVTHCVPVFEGYAIRHAIDRINIAGRDVTEHLARLLNIQQDLSFVSSSEMEIVRDIKEKLGFVYYGLDGEERREIGEIEATYVLPDGQSIVVGNERFQAPEILFNPLIVGKDHHGVPEMLRKCIFNCDIDLRANFLKGIVLSGGSTMFPGFSERLKVELEGLVPYGIGKKVNVVNAEGGEFSVYTGASILASLSSFASSWIFSDEYMEAGPSIVHRKCF